MQKKRESICNASINEKIPMKDSIQIFSESVLDLKDFFLDELIFVPQP